VNNELDDDALIALALERRDAVVNTTRDLVQLDSQTPPSDIHLHNVDDLSCLEPACNRGHMSKVLGEYFETVTSSDIHDYGYGGGDICDFLNGPYSSSSFDWVITNPPFKLAEEFVNHALSIAKSGVAILARTVFLESVGRHKSLFTKNPPTIFAQFSERVPMVKGRLDKKASTATSYGWFVWDNHLSENTELVWIPPVRRTLEKHSDYDLPSD